MQRDHETPEQSRDVPPSSSADAAALPGKDGLVSIRWPMRTIPELLAASAHRYGDRVAVHAPGRRALTYADLTRQVERTASTLAESGFGRKDRIGIALPHGPEFAVAIVATLGSAACAPLNGQQTEDAITALVEAMRLTALIVPEGADSAAANAARRMAIPTLRLRAEPEAPAGTFELRSERQRAPVERVPAQPHDLALVSHTSGTTGAPKVLALQHWRLAEDARLRCQLGAAAIRADDRCLAVAPFYSLAAIRHSLLWALAVGGSIVCPTTMDVDTLVTLLETERPTQLLAPPVVQIALLDELERRVPRPAHSLRFLQSGFTELTPAVKHRLEHAFGVPVVRVYGMSETGLISQSSLPPGPEPPESVGRPVLLEVAIADEAGRHLPAGERGEIVVRGPHIFEGYENDPEASRLAFRDGWFRTGDAGRMDAAGFLFVSGRIKDIINRGGNKIAPAEIESAVLEHPQVAQAAAFAVPHPTLGEDAALAVVLRHPGTRTNELRQFLRCRLAPRKLPSRILVLPQLPRGTLEKVDRRRLAELAGSVDASEQELPATAEESVVARIFAETLGVPAVGRHGDFFELGGDSLRSIRVLVAVESAFGVEVPMEALFDHPTVAAFAVQIAAAVAARRDDPARTQRDSPDALAGDVPAERT